MGSIIPLGAGGFLVVATGQRPKDGEVGERSLSGGVPWMGAASILVVPFRHEVGLPWSRNGLPQANGTPLGNGRGDGT